MNNINGGNGANATPADDYIEFTITPDAGQTLSFNTISLDFLKASGGAEVFADLRWSVDSFDSSLGAGSVTDFTWQAILSEDISGLAGQTTATTFRVLLSTGGNNNDLFVDNFVLTGSAIPEPSAFALLAGMFGLTWVMLRRRG